MYAWPCTVYIHPCAVFCVQNRENVCGTGKRRRRSISRWLGLADCQLFVLSMLIHNQRVFKAMERASSVRRAAKKTAMKAGAKANWSRTRRPTAPEVPVMVTIRLRDRYQKCSAGATSTKPCNQA